MSIEQTDTVDFLSIKKDSGEAWLTISDHLDWDQEEDRHLFLLQDKLNAYLRFIESGEMVERFPEAKGRKVVIDLVGRFPLSKKAELFFNKAERATRDAGFELQFRFRPD